MMDTISQDINRRWQYKVQKALNDMRELYSLPDCIEKDTLIFIFEDKYGKYPSVEEIEDVCSAVWVTGMRIERCFEHVDIEFRKGSFRKDVERVFRYLEELGYEIA